MPTLLEKEMMESIKIRHILVDMNAGYRLGECIQDAVRLAVTEWRTVYIDNEAVGGETLKCDPREFVAHVIKTGNKWKGEV